MRKIYYIVIGSLVILSYVMIMNQIGRSDKYIDPVPGSCTIFSVSIGDKVFFGNNEDFYKSKTFIWTDAGTKEKYGCMYLGFENFSHQGGINEKGLCFDANALPKTTINLHAELEPPPHYKVPYDEYMIWIPVLILRKAATVDEAIEIAKKYQRKNWYPKNGKIKYQLNFADSHGDAVVMSFDENGELVFTEKDKGANNLISTNFNKANNKNALEYPCDRYEHTENTLTRLKSENDLNVDYIKSLLQSVHQKGIFSRTLYSNIFDLKNGVVYLYYKHQFDEVIELNLNEELAKEPYVIRIKDLFSQETVKSASKEYVMSIILLSFKILVALLLMFGLLQLLRIRINTVGNNV